MIYFSAFILLAAGALNTTNYAMEKPRFGQKTQALLQSVKDGNNNEEKRIAVQLHQRVLNESEFLKKITAMRDEQARIRDEQAWQEQCSKRTQEITARFDRFKTAVAAFDTQRIQQAGQALEDAKFFFSLAERWLGTGWQDEYLLAELYKKTKLTDAVYKILDKKVSKPCPEVIQAIQPYCDIRSKATKDLNDRYCSIPSNFHLLDTFLLQGVVLKGQDLLRTAICQGKSSIVRIVLSHYPDWATKDLLMYASRNDTRSDTNPTTDCQDDVTLEVLSVIDDTLDIYNKHFPDFPHEYVKRQLATYHPIRVAMLAWFIKHRYNLNHISQGATVLDLLMALLMSPGQGSKVRVLKKPISYLIGERCITSDPKKTHAAVEHKVKALGLLGADYDDLVTEQQRTTAQLSKEFKSFDLILKELKRIANSDHVVITIDEE